MTDDPMTDDARTDNAMMDDAISDEEIRALLQVASAQPPLDALRGVRMAGASVLRPHRTIIPAVGWRGTAAVAGVAGGAVLVTLAVGVIGVGSAPSAQAQVTAAVDTTAGESFRVHIVQNNGAVYDGVSDPTRSVGMSIQSNGSEWRYIGNTVYAKKVGAGLPPGKMWVAETRPSDDELAQVPAEALLLKIAPDDPKSALQRLRSKATFTDSGNAAGQGWTGKRYAFTLYAAAGTGSVKQSRGETGSIDIDDQGRIRQVTFALAAEPGNGATALHETMTFSDFRVPVNVTPPPASQVVTDAQNLPKEADPQDSNKAQTIPDKPAGAKLSAP